MQNIGYTNKSALNQNAGIADINKCNATDLNEIKTVVNANATECGNASSLNTTDKTSLVNAINEVNATATGLVPVVVYQNSTGSNSNITLSQSVDSAKELHITYRQSGYTSASKTDIMLPSETKHQLSFIHSQEISGTPAAYLFSAYISVSGTTLTYTDGFALATNSETSYNTTGNTIYITKIVAYY